MDSGAGFDQHLRGCGAELEFRSFDGIESVVFRVPNRENAMVHISGRSANVHDRECSYELSPLTRWTIGGAAADKDVPPPPIFGLNSPGQGRCEVSGIGFTNLENTRTISAGKSDASLLERARAGPQRDSGAGCLRTRTPYSMCRMPAHSVSGQLFKSALSLSVSMRFRRTTCG